MNRREFMKGAALVLGAALVAPYVPLTPVAVEALPGVPMGMPVALSTELAADDMLHFQDYLLDLFGEAIAKEEDQAIWQYRLA